MFRIRLLKAFATIKPTEWASLIRRLVKVWAPKVDESITVISDFAGQTIAAADSELAEQLIAKISGAEDSIEQGVFCAGTYDPNKYDFSGYGLSSVTDMGVGQYRFVFVTPSADPYIVTTSANGALVSIVDKDVSGFTVHITEPKSGFAHDSVINFICVTVGRQNREY